MNLVIAFGYSLALAKPNNNQETLLCVQCYNKNVNETTAGTLQMLLQPCLTFSSSHCQRNHVKWSTSNMCPIIGVNWTMAKTVKSEHIMDILLPLGDQIELIPFAEISRHKFGVPTTYYDAKFILC